LNECVYRPTRNAKRVRGNRDKQDYQNQPGIIERSCFKRRVTQETGLGIRHPNVIEYEILTAGATHPNNGPCILNRRLIRWNQHGPDFRRPGFGQLRLVAIHNYTRAIKPVGMIDAARKIPVSSDTIAAISGIGVPEWSQRASATKIGRVTT